MQTVGIRQLKNQLSEFIRRAKAGEAILITSHGEVVAELRAPQEDRDLDVPAGLLDLSRRGLARRLVRNQPGRYRDHDPALKNTTASELLDWSREER